METGLAGRTAVVAGASQGIGRAVCQAFAFDSDRGNQLRFCLTTARSGAREGDTSCRNASVPGLPWLCLSHPFECLQRTLRFRPICRIGADGCCRAKNFDVAPISRARKPVT